MEKQKFERPVINKINAGVPDKFGMRTHILPVTQLDGLSVKDIIEEFGSGLSQEELDESIGVVMENVPGLETESTQEIQRLIESIRRKYDDEIQYIRDQDGFYPVTTDG